MTKLWQKNLQSFFMRHRVDVDVYNGGVSELHDYIKHTKFQNVEKFSRFALKT